MSAPRLPIRAATAACAPTMRHYHAWQKLKETDLDHAYLLLVTLSSDALACLGRDPVSMPHPCQAMMLCGVTSFPVWVGMMRDEPF